MSGPATIPQVSCPPATGLNVEAEAALQQCGALKDFWYVACLSQELHPDRPVMRTIFGTPLVLFRDTHGQAAALHDRCLHRNARLSAGHVINGCLACPYHGWTYDRAGRCVDIPSLGPSQHGQGLSPAAHARAGLALTPTDVGRVASRAILEQDGLVYVFMGDDVAQARRPPLRLPYWGDPAWQTYSMVTPFRNGVTNLVENFMDVPHTVFVHAGWFRTRTRKQVLATVERAGGVVTITYQQAQDTLTGLGRILNPHSEPMCHTDCFSIPNTTRVDYAFGSRSGFVITSQCTPVAAMESMVYTAISYRLPFDLPANLIARLLRPLITWYTTHVIRQDVRIMQIQRDGLMQSPGGGRFVSTAADLPHTDIEAYRAWLLAGAPGEGPDNATRDIILWI